MLILIQFRTRDCKTSTAEIQNQKLSASCCGLGVKRRKEQEARGQTELTKLPLESKIDEGRTSSDMKAVQLGVMRVQT